MRLPRLLGHGLSGTAMVLALALVSALWGGARADQGSPRDLVATASEELMTTLAVSGDTLRSDPRFAWRLAERTVLPHIDFDRVGRRVLGKHWRAASAEQRAAYLDAFRGYASNFVVKAMVTYSAEMVSYADRITFPPARWRPGDDRATVRMHVKLTSGITAEVQYRMHVVDGTWRIWDVTLEGVSLVLMYRDSFDEEIKRHGLDGFIDRLATHAARRPS